MEHDLNKSVPPFNCKNKCTLAFAVRILALVLALPHTCPVATEAVTLVSLQKN